MFFPGAVQRCGITIQLVLQVLQGFLCVKFRPNMSLIEIQANFQLTPIN